MEYMFAVAFLALTCSLAVIYHFNGDQELEGGKYLVKETKWNMVVNPLPFVKLKAVVEDAHRKEKMYVLCKILTMRLKRIPEDIFLDIKSLNLDQLDFIIDQSLNYEDYKKIQMDLYDLLESKEVI